MLYLIIAALICLIAGTITAVKAPSGDAGLGAGMQALFLWGAGIVLLVCAGAWWLFMHVQFI